MDMNDGPPKNIIYIICFSETGDWHHLMEVSTGTGLKRKRVTYFPTNQIDWWMEESVEIWLNITVSHLAGYGPQDDEQRT